MEVIDKRHTFELVLHDVNVDKQGNVISEKVRSKTFSSGDALYAWAVSNRPNWAFEVKTKDKKKNKKDS